MAFYLPEMGSGDDSTPDVMLAAARRLLDGARSTDDELPIGVGLHTGVASVGNVRKGDIKDFTVVGDVVNTAARLQSCAAVDEIVISETAFTSLTPPTPPARNESFDVKGKAMPLRARVVEASSS